MSGRMTALEHLTENALIAMQKADKESESVYEAFLETMQNGYGREALEMYGIDKNVLWEVLQYVYYTWIKERNEK